MCCSVLRCVAVTQSLRVADRDVSIRYEASLCCSVLQCVAACCSVLQCVAVCCSVLQCVAVCFAAFEMKEYMALFPKEIFV